MCDAKNVLEYLCFIYYPERKHCFTSGESQIYSMDQLQLSFTRGNETAHLFVILYIRHTLSCSSVFLYKSE